MQTCLEKKGIEARNEDALATGDPLGKGTGHGGHTHSVPDCTKPSAIDYSNFDTENGGGLYDIEGRNGVGGRIFLKNISVYNETFEYGPNLVDTSLNVADGQIRV